MHRGKEGYWKRWAERVETSMDRMRVERPYGLYRAERGREGRDKCIGREGRDKCNADPTDDLEVPAAWACAAQGKTPAASSHLFPTTSAPVDAHRIQVPSMHRQKEAAGALLLRM